MSSSIPDWPSDADGDVFRRLAASGFDFSRDWSVDYNVDFENWPPTDCALKLLEFEFGALSLFPPDESGIGYVQFQILGPVTYEHVTSTQQRVTDAMRPFGGVCESWGVLH